MDLLKLNFWNGRKTYFVGILMLLHAVSESALELLNGQPLSWTDAKTQELLTGAGFIGLRKGMS